MSEDRDSKDDAGQQGVLDPGDEHRGMSDEQFGLSRSLEASFTSIARSGPLYHPIFDKLESEHVTQFLSSAREREENEFRYKTTGRWFRIAYVLIGIAAFSALTVFLVPDQSDIYFDILKSVGIFGAGVAGGYGIKTYQDRSRD